MCNAYSIEKDYDMDKTNWYEEDLERCNKADNMIYKIRIMK